MTVIIENLIPARRESVPLRFITATSLFDGHDAAINIIRRLLQAQGVEVIHLGHNWGVDEIVRAALQEDVDAIAVSSYQGGHMEFFKYLVDSLKAQHADNIRVFGGGGGTITAAEAAELEAYGVEKIYTAEEGGRLGLVSMIKEVIERTRQAAARHDVSPHPTLQDHRGIGRTLSLIELGVNFIPARKRRLRSKRQWDPCPVIGFTGPGGSGKSSVIDEILNRLLRGFPDLRIGLIAMDPTRRKGGGALLGDRIRMNATVDPRVYMRSMATRRPHLATNAVLSECIDFLKSLEFGLILVETAGIGQGDTEIVDLVDLSVYVMTSEYGAPSQLEKVEMLDHADLVVLNKFDKRGAEDALRDIRKQWRRNHNAFSLPEVAIPVYSTIMSLPHDPGVDRLFLALCDKLSGLPGKGRWTPGYMARGVPSAVQTIVPPARVRYLAEIAEQGRAERAAVEREVRAASKAQAHYRSLMALGDPRLPAPLERYSEIASGHDPTFEHLGRCYHDALDELSEESIGLLQGWPETRAGVEASQYTYNVRGHTVTGENYVESLSHLRIPKVALPRDEDWGGLLRFLKLENLPGRYPYAAGVYPYRRTYEDPTRMFAGEGGPEHTNRRFHSLTRGQKSIRLSTAFDPIVLYGEDPDVRPDIFGRLGMSGVSVATLDDLKKLYSGFDLAAPTTSVSMTINGPAPVALAWFMNAAIDQQVENYLREGGRWELAEKRIARIYEHRERPRYRGDLPSGHNGLGLGLLGVTGDQVVERDIYERIRQDVLRNVRGTVQADILKEDQAQNECIFAIEFALRMMGDIQAFFIANEVRNYYSVSVSGYHIAEAGANPITQLAFTLANGFTLVEYYRSRGMRVDEFAPNMSFFFSNGMDPEYAVLGRVARRIWARAMHNIYKASLRSQMLKYHIQTSGRSLHAQEVGFNDIRTTLQALYGIFDNCNSLHTNAYDEAVTTPTEESVRRALAIQMIINRELGLNVNENPWQGSFIIETLTDLVEEAVYQEFERISERGGVLGAMETLYQRSKIQEESLYYEHRKHDGSLPIVGVNTYVREGGLDESPPGQLVRASDEEKRTQIEALDLFKRNHAEEAPKALKQLQGVVHKGGNTFAELMDTVRHCTLGQITYALYEVGGQYRRRM